MRNTRAAFSALTPRTPYRFVPTRSADRGAGDSRYHLQRREA